jgi:hypothetical protein
MITTPGLFDSVDQQNCFYQPDQRSFFFALYANDTGTLLHLGHVVDLAGEAVTPDWKSFSSCDVGPTVEIYKDSGAIQCESSGISVSEMNESLINAGIEVLKWGDANTGLATIALCGALTFEIYAFSIRESDLSMAENLGFRRVSELPWDVELNWY